MRTLLKLDEAGALAVALVAFSWLEYPWWLYAALFLLPDVSAVGYLAGPRTGAHLYNLAHHQGVAVCVGLVGVWVGSAPAVLAGTELLGHSALDRIFGFGLKYPDAFGHTHLDEIS